MKENANKHIDQFVDRVMKSSKLETPSFDFTAKIMSQITVNQRSKVTVYKPLISKTTWGILLVLTAGMVGFQIFSQESTSLGWFDKLDFSIVSNLFSGVKISQTTMYSLLMFGVMLFIQIPLLKHYFNKRFEA